MNNLRIVLAQHLPNSLFDRLKSIRTILSPSLLWELRTNLESNGSCIYPLTNHIVDSINPFTR